MDIAVAKETLVVQQNAKTVGGAGAVQAVYRSVRPGGILSQLLLKDNPEEGPNFRLMRSTYQSGEDAFSSPRHHHSFQQIRWAESGSVNYAPDHFIEEGDIGYFPRAAYYGPQLKDSGVALVLQFGFGAELQGGAIWESFRSKAMDELESVGRFEDGMYFDVDPETGHERKRDGAQVVSELTCVLATGKKFVIPPARYEYPVLMHPKSFEYRDYADGVETKVLGRFFDHAGDDGDVAISMVRLSGGSYVFEADRSQIAWAPTAGLRIDGRTYPEMTCLYIPLNESAEISADSNIELYVIAFPRLH
jgi:hypothetical protein